MPIEQASEDLLIEDEYIRASAGKRLANYLIDIIVFYLIAFAFGIVLAIVSPSSVEGLANERDGLNILSRLVSLLFYALYMSVIESIFKGKSIGKFITKTRAVNLDGSRISTKTAFARGLSRAVPFCVFSALGNPCDPWQDKWTNTMVIDERNQSYGFSSSK